MHNFRFQPCGRLRNDDSNGLYEYYCGPKISIDHGKQPRVYVAPFQLLDCCRHDLTSKLVGMAFARCQNAAWPLAGKLLHGACTHEYINRPLCRTIPLAQPSATSAPRRSRPQSRAGTEVKGAARSGGHDLPLKVGHVRRVRGPPAAGHLLAEPGRLLRCGRGGARDGRGRVTDLNDSIQDFWRFLVSRV